MITTLLINDEKLDQQQSESVDLVNSVVDIRDITKNTNAYTKDFTVPASQINSKIFKHYYDADIDGGFDARKTAKGTILIDGMPFKLGKFRLLKVTVEHGKPKNYTINFSGNLLDLKRTAKDYELSDAFVGITTYDHDFSSTNVYNGLTGAGLFSGDVIYTLFAKKQYYINGDGVDETQTDQLSNIAFEGGAGSGVIWSDLRPSLRVIRILEEIETFLGVTFSRHFFGTTEFTRLFMWLNPDKSDGIRGNYRTVDWDNNTVPPANPGMFGPYMNLTTDEGSYPITANGWWLLSFAILPDPGFELVVYTMRIIVNGETFAELEIPSGGNSTGGWGRVVGKTLNEPIGSYIASFEVSSEQDFEYTAFLNQSNFDNASTEIDSAGTTASSQALQGDLIVSQNLPKLKIITFLKGLFNAFKLVIIPEDDGTYYVNTIKAYYAEGVSYDITRYTDFSKYEVERGEIFSEIVFKFEDPTTRSNILYESINGKGYGDEVWQVDEAEQLDGGELTVELPFEQFIYERLVDQFTSIPVNTLYAAIIDEDREPADPAAHLFYHIREGTGATTIGFIDDTGVKLPIPLPAVNTPNHGNSLENSVFSFLFSAEFSEWDGNSFQNNLYSNHYKDYIEAVFNIKKRTFKFSAYLPPHIRTKLGLNDILYIKDRYYRISKDSYNLLTGKTDFELINSFDNTIAPFFLYPETISIEYRATSEKIFLTDASISTFVNNDLGHGTGWVTASGVPASVTEVNVLTLTLTENTTGLPRTMTVTATHTVTGKTATIYVYQSEQVYIPKFDFSDARNTQYIPILLTGRN